MLSYLLVLGSISAILLTIFIKNDMVWSNLYAPILFLAVGCGFIGIRNLRKLKAEIGEKFGEVDKKTYDAIVGIYFAVYILIFVQAIPGLFFPLVGTVHNMIDVATGVLFGIWAVGLSSPYYDYLTVSREKTSIFWKVPVVTLAMLWHGFWNTTGPLENGRPLALFILVSTLEFVIRILLRRNYIKIKGNKLLEK